MFHSGTARGLISLFLVNRRVDLFQRSAAPLHLMLRAKCSCEIVADLLIFTDAGQPQSTMLGSASERSSCSNANANRYANEADLQSCE